MPLNSRKAFPWVFGFYLLLFLFTTFVLLFEFVIPHGGIHVDDPVITTTENVTTDGTGAAGETTTALLSYPGTAPDVLDAGTVIGFHHTETLLITVYQIRAHNSDVYVADVVVADAAQILTALAYNIFGGRNIVQDVSEMAEEHDALFAINSDYASHYDTGYVIRNGMILRSSSSYRNAIALYLDGSVASFKETDTTVQAVLDDGAWQLWSFGPVLIKDGVSVASVNDGLDRDAVNNPRSAFGAVGTNHYMFVCVDGRTDVSAGVDIEELADIMRTLSCHQAYNFDGGGSATMWYDGDVINHPSEGDERGVGDCVYIRG